MMDFDTERMRASDRTIVLKRMEGKSVTTNNGTVDNRLFVGGNNLHAIRDNQTCLWTMRYEHGLLQAPLRQQFTSFDKVLQHAKDYFGRRGVEIVEVID